MISLLSSLFLIAECSAQGSASHYDVDLSVDPASGALLADATVTLAPMQVRSEQTFLLGDTYQVVSTASDDADIEVGAGGQGFRPIVVRPRASAGERPVSFTLRYQGPIRDTGTPPLNAISPERVELSLDAGWLPIRSDFTLRYSSCLRIDGLPPGLDVVSQGVVSRQGDTVLIAREAPDFDLTFVAAPDLEAVADEGFELYAAAPDGDVEKLYRRHGAESLRYLEDWFGEIPGRPVRVVMVDRPRNSGYARSGYVVVTRGRGGGETGLAKFIAHEFAHAWSPTADPMSEHHWLAESTAEYVALRYVEEALGAAALESLLAPKRLAAEDAPPILGGGRRNDAVLYAKGALLLFDLEARMGRPAMDALMRDFARERPSTTPAFMDLLARHADAATVAAFAGSLTT